MDSPVWIYLLGLGAQGLYGLRILAQWYLSEKSRRVESPAIYFILSLGGALLMVVYGWLRHDPAIIIGELLTYYIYLWNVGAHGVFRRLPRGSAALLAALPPLLLLLAARSAGGFPQLFSFPEITGGLAAFGLVSQLTFKSRHLYQFIYSYRRGKSVLPLGFWLISLLGAVLVIIYALIRHDWALLAGQFGIFFTIRNLTIYFSAKKEEN